MSKMAELDIKEKSERTCDELADELIASHEFIQSIYGHFREAGLTAKQAKGLIEAHVQTAINIAIRLEGKNEASTADRD